MDTDVPGPSTRVEDPIEIDYGQEGDRRAPDISQIEIELKEKMEQAKDDVERDCMEGNKGYYTQHA